MVKGITLIFVFLFLGEFIAEVTPLPIPGNIIGMILLFISLVFNFIKLEEIAPAGDLLLEHLILYFIPVSIGIISYKELLRDEFVSFSVIVVGGFLILYFLVSKMIDLLVCNLEKRES